jgi:hypothetical protein
MQSSGSDLEGFGETSNCNSPVRDLICDTPDLEKGFFFVAVLSVHSSERTGEKQRWKLINDSLSPSHCESQH